MLPHETYPATRRHTRELVDVTDEQIFFNAVELMIAGIEAVCGNREGPVRAAAG